MLEPLSSTEILVKSSDTASVDLLCIHPQGQITHNQIIRSGVTVCRHVIRKVKDEINMRNASKDIPVCSKGRAWRKGGRLYVLIY